MKRVVSSIVLLLVLSISSSAFSQERNVIVNTNSAGRTVITTNPNSNGNVDIWAQLEQERIAAEKAEQERIAAEKKAEQERIEAEKRAEQERIEAAKRAEQERLAAEKAEQERIAAEKKAEQERLAAEKAEQERIAAEKKAEQERLAAEEAEHLAAEKAEQERLAAEKKAHSDSVKTARKERIAAYPWSNLIMVNGAYALCPEYAFGITYARVKQYGFYISAMMNPSILFQADNHATATGKINDEYPFYSGEHKSTRISGIVGGLVRLYIPMYFYAGVGYGYRGLFYETTDHKWVAWHTENTIYHGMHWEAGLMGNIKGFAISLGVSSITDFSNMYYEAKLGLGYCF